MSASSSGAGFAPIRPNPFIVGNPVRDQKMFFGREAEFELVLNRFKHSENGGLLVFCGERRSGKTSILFQILDGRLGDEFIPVLIDMQAMAVESESEFLGRVASEILQRVHSSLVAPDFSTATNAALRFQSFVHELLRRHPNKKLILLVDEYELFEDKIDSGVLTSHVLNVFAGLMEQLPTFFVFTGSQHLDQRKKDYWRILGKSEYRRISFLQPKDAVQLIEQPVAGRVHYGEGVVDAILRLSAGQPFYTQAICQNIVDQLNERKTNRADAAILDGVVQQIVESPFPQMIFLWSTLRQPHKLALALLAQTLPGAGDFATARQIGQAISSGRYPLNLSSADLSTALDELFQDELLIKNEAREPGYAFRMDLWRLWIARMHSVWQVMREEGLEIRSRRRGPSRRSTWVAVGAVLLTVVAVMMLRHRDGVPSPPENRIGAPTRPSAHLALVVAPAAATIRIDGNPVGLGQFQGPLFPGEHRLELSAPGYADSAWTVAAIADQGLKLQVQLRALVGSLSVQSTPPGAQILLNGEPIGAAPVQREQLPIAAPYRVVARLAGYQDAEREVELEVGKSTSLTISLARNLVPLTILSTPVDAQIFVDSQLRGRSPLRLPDLTQGSHRFRFELAGYVSRDTLLALDSSVSELRLELFPEPPGILVVVGDVPARIYIDDRLVAQNLQNSGNQALSPGTHQIEVVLGNGQSHRASVELRSGQRLVYDFSRQAVQSSNPQQE